MDVRDIALIHSVLDGDASPEQVRQLEQRAAADVEVRDELQAMRALGDLLARVPPADPPVTLATAALARFDQLFAAPAVFGGGAEAARAAGNREAGVATSTSLIASCWKLIKESMMVETGTGLLGSTRAKVFAGSVAAAALVYVVSVSIDSPADSRGAVGTIAPAQRAQVSQIAATDVKLGEQQAAQLMQTDMYRNLVKSDAFREVMKNDASRVFLQSEAFREVMKSDSFLQALKLDSFREALKTDAFREALKNDAFREALKNDSLREALKSDAFREALKSDGAREALKSDAFREVAKLDSFRVALKNDAFLLALKNDAFREALKNDAFMLALKSDSFREALKNDAFMVALKTDAFREALKSDAFRVAASNDAFREALKSDAFMKMLKVDAGAAAAQ